MTKSKPTYTGGFAEKKSVIVIVLGAFGIFLPGRVNSVLTESEMSETSNDDYS